MTTSRDCVTTEQKANFMLQACKPDNCLWIIEDIGNADKWTGKIPYTHNSHRWNFDRYTYELRPRKLADAEKIEKALELLNFPAARAHPVVKLVIAILKGESHG